MFNKIFDRIDDFDMDKLVEVVNLVWNNRQKIMDLIERLPEMLRETGDNIESAGDSAIRASHFLVGDGKADSASANKMSEMAASALERCYAELQSVAQGMEKFGEDLDAIKIPRIRPKYVDVLGQRLISGVDIDEDGLLDDPAQRLKEGSDRLSDIGQDLSEVAKSMRQLGGMLTDTGKDLSNVGEKLRSSGRTLRSFSDLRK